MCDAQTLVFLVSNNRFSLQQIVEKAMSKRFRVSDEAINNYGFRVLTSGIDMSGFNLNPIGLYNHNGLKTLSDETLPICRWEQVVTENNEMFAVPVFSKLEHAQKIATLVDEDILRAASIGIQILEVSSDPALMLDGQTKPTVTRCRLREISIVDIPSNKYAVALYDADDNLIENLSDALPDFDFTKNKNSEMKKIYGMFNLADDTNEDVVVGEIKKLSARAEAAEAQLKAVKGAQVKEILDAAEKEGRINAATRPAYEKLFDADFNNAKAIVDSLQPIVKLSQIPNPTGGNSTLSDGKYNGKTFSQLFETDAALLKNLKDQNPEVFKSLYKAEYGIDYKD